MYKVSTFFIKGQLPGLTLDYLIDLYKSELQLQSAGKVDSDSSTIYFTNDNIFRFATGYSTKYSNFSSGRIDITETEEEFIVYLQASLSNLFIKPGLFAGLATLFLLVATGFEFFTVIVGLLVFGLMTLTSYISTSISFPTYFTYFRNGVEHDFQARQ